jgi:hypothetical protein
MPYSRQILNAAEQRNEAYLPTARLTERRSPVGQALSAASIARTGKRLISTASCDELRSTTRRREKTRRIGYVLSGILLISFLTLGVALAQTDIEGSKDHPLITRMPGYYITEYNVSEFGGFDPTVIGGAGISWLHRWAIALGGKAAILPGETPCPAWVMEAAGVDSD